MESGEDADSDDNSHGHHQVINENTQETTGINVARSTPTSCSSNSSVNDPSPSVSNSSLLHATGTVDKTNWKSPNAFLNYVQDFRQNLRKCNEVIQQSNVIRIAGQQWRVMPDVEKRVYVDGALAIKKSRSKNIDERKRKPKRERGKSRVRDKQSSTSANLKKKAKRKH